MEDAYLLSMWRPVWRRRDSHSGFRTELENLIGDVKRKGTSGSNREAESIDAPQAIAIEIGSTGNGRSPMFNGRRQPSRGGTSRMTRECQVRICEGLGVKFPGPTRHSHRSQYPRQVCSWTN